MWDDNGRHTCDACGKQMGASDICSNDAYGLCWDCCDIEDADEFAVCDGECAECGKWATIHAGVRLCGICLAIRNLDEPNSPIRQPAS